MIPQAPPSEQVNGLFRTLEKSDSVEDAARAVVLMLACLDKVPAVLLACIKAVYVEAGDNGHGGDKAAFRIEFGP